MNSVGSACVQLALHQRLLDALEAVCTLKSSLDCGTQGLLSGGGDRWELPASRPETSYLEGGETKVQRGGLILAPHTQQSEVAEPDLRPRSLLQPVSSEVLREVSS